jgi:hypothetical protein
MITFRLLLPFVLVILISACTRRSRSEIDYRHEVQLFLRDSGKEQDIFPWKGRSPAVERIVQLGTPVSAYLVESLADIQDFYDGKDFDFKVQQNITIALCRIYGMEPVFGPHSYGVRSSQDENLKVFAYWKALTQSSPSKIHGATNDPR